MSSSQVGIVYQKIIDDVIADSATNFDEGGVERQLLDDLKAVWQEKLSGRHVAEMPWDPPPAPQPLNLPIPQPQVPTPPAAPTNATPPVKPEPVVKQEPAYTEYSSGVVPASQHAGAGLQRAGQFIQDKFGASANGSLNALQAQQQAARVTAEQQQVRQAREAQQAQQQAAIQAQLNMQSSMSTDASRQEYNKMLADQMKRQQMRLQQGQQQQRSVPQTDGAGDWKAFVAERRALTDEAIAAADMTFRQRIEQDTAEIDGALMMPASKVKTPRGPIRRNPGQSMPQLDGVDDDEIKHDEDEDAINSDLDDPDDEAAVGSDDEDNGGEVIVCLYDKVQRVKNKWKCTLKDGILSSGGKEYVFTKAQGEFEW